MSLDRALPMSPPGQLSSYLPLHSGHRLCLRSHMRNFEIGPTARWSTLDPIYIKLFFKVLAIPFIWYQVCEDPLSLIFFVKICLSTQGKSGQETLWDPKAHRLYTAAVTSVSHEVRPIEPHRSCHTAEPRHLPRSPPGQLSSDLPLHSGHRLCLWSHMRNFEIVPTARWSTLDPHIY